MKRTISLSRRDWTLVEGLLQEAISMCMEAPDFDPGTIPEGEAKNALNVGNYVVVMNDAEMNLPMRPKLMTGQQWYDKFVKYAQEHGIETFDRIPETQEERDQEIQRLIMKWARESTGAD